MSWSFEGTLLPDGTTGRVVVGGPAAPAWLDCGPGDDLVTYEADPRSAPEVLATPAAVVLRGRRVR